MAAPPPRSVRPRSPNIGRPPRTPERPRTLRDDGATRRRCPTTRCPAPSLPPMAVRRRDPQLECFAQCTPGLEALVVDELAGLGVRRPRPELGGVVFPASARQLYAANLWLRVAS